MAATLSSSVRSALGGRRAFPQLSSLRLISLGAKVPGGVKVKEVVGDAVNEVSSEELFKGKKIVLDKHLPGYLAALPQFKSKGVDKVAVLCVNDFFAAKAWGKAQKLGEAISILADGNGELTKALGQELDLSKALLGVRSKRFSAVIENGVVKALNVEPDGTGYTVSAAEATLKQL